MKNLYFILVSCMGWQVCGIYVLRKAHMHSTLILRSIPNIQTFQMFVWLTILSFQERSFSASSFHANTKGITHHISSRRTPRRFLFSSGSEMLGLHYTREPKRSHHGAWGCDRSSADHHLGGIPFGWNPSAGTCVLIGSYSSCRCMMHRLHHRCSLFLNKGRKR